MGRRGLDLCLAFFFLEGMKYVTMMLCAAWAILGCVLLFQILRFPSSIPEAFVGYSLYDGLRDRVMNERPEAFSACVQQAAQFCGPRDGRPGSDRRCFSLAMSECMTPSGVN